MDLIIRQVRLPQSQSLWDLGISDGKFVAIEPHLDQQFRQEIKAEGYLAAPPFVDAHFHLDATLSYGYPRVNQSGTLLEGIALWGELKPDLTQAAIQERALNYCDWAIARGIQAIRAHVDVCDPRLLAVEALVDVKRQVKPYLDLQLVAFPQDGYFRSPHPLTTLAQALDLGVDVVGGIPHFERTYSEGTASIKALCELAAERGLRVDMHCDETDDPLSRHVETLAFETQRLGLQGRVTGSHLTSMHSMDNAYVSKLITLMHEAELSVVANPLINIVLQGRQDTYPRRRGMTRVPELLGAGLTVAFGHDCVLDPWYPLGSANMLEVAHMGLHVAQMTGVKAMQQCFTAVTESPAQILGLEDYGIAPGKPANLNILQASDPVEAIRLRSVCLYVIRKGRVIARTDPQVSSLNLPGRPSTVDFRVPFPPQSQT